MAAELIAGLVRLTFTASIAMVAVMALRPLIRRLGGPRIAYGLWALIPLAVVASLLPAPPAGLSPIQESAAVRSVADAAVQIDAIWVRPSAQALAASPIPSPVDMQWVWLTLWTVGFGVLAVRLFWLETAFARRISGLEPDPLQRDVFYGQDEHAGPAVVGLWKSRIILPVDFMQRYAEDERPLVLEHERTHLRSRHPLAVALAYLFLIVQWFNPLAHLAFALFRVDQELACDATVVAAYPKQRAAYARAMFKTGDSRVSAPLACCWPSGAHPVRDRIAMLRVALPSRAQRLTGATLTMLAVSLGALAAYAAVPSAHPAAAPIIATLRTVDFLPQVLAGAGQITESGKVPSKEHAAAPRSIKLAEATVAAERNTVGPKSSDELLAERDQLLAIYYRMNPGERGVNPRKLRDALGEEGFQRFVAVDRAYYASRYDGLAAQVQTIVPDLDQTRAAPPLSFTVPAGMAAAVVARAAGVSVADYGYDVASPPDLKVFFRCGLPETPVTTAC